MANFDTTTIEGFDAMTAEQKVEALLKAEIPEKVDLSKYVSKETFDKKASEAASLSKQLKEKPTDDVTQLKNRIAELEKNETVAKYRDKLTDIGYDRDLAMKTAKALADGDTETVFANSRKYAEELQKKIKKELLDGTPFPGGHGGEEHKDGAVEKARELAKAKNGNGKSYDDVLKHYKR